MFQTTNQLYLCDQLCNWVPTCANHSVVLKHFLSLNTLKHVTQAVQTSPPSCQQLSYLISWPISPSSKSSSMKLTLRAYELSSCRLARWTSTWETLNSQSLKLGPLDATHTYTIQYQWCWPDNYGFRSQNCVDSSKPSFGAINPMIWISWYSHDGPLIFPGLTPNFRPTSTGESSHLRSLLDRQVRRRRLFRQLGPAAAAAGRRRLARLCYTKCSCIGFYWTMIELMGCSNIQTHHSTLVSKFRNTGKHMLILRPQFWEISNQISYQEGCLRRYDKGLHRTDWGSVGSTVKRALYNHRWITNNLKKLRKQQISWSHNHCQSFKFNIWEPSCNIMWLNPVLQQYMFQNVDKKR